MQVLYHGKVVGTSQKWPAKAGGRSPKRPAVAGTTVHSRILSWCDYQWMTVAEVMYALLMDS